MVSCHQHPISPPRVFVFHKKPLCLWKTVQILFRQYRIILSADTASEVRQMVPQPDIIEHFGNADAVPHPPERCLSRKAGIVRCCLHFFPVVTRSAFLFLPTNCPCSRKVYRNFQLFHALFIRSSFLFFMIESIGGPYYRPQLEELLCTKPNSRATPKRRPALYMP